MKATRMDLYQEVKIQNSAEVSALACHTEVDLRIPCYCEENVWRLAYRRLKEQSELNSAKFNYYVIFVSNEMKCCPMFNQKAKKDKNEACFWDYHVIFLGCMREKNKQDDLSSENSEYGGDASIESDNHDKSSAYIFDMDSQLDYPCRFSTYIDETFRNVELIPIQYKHRYSPFFRVIEAELFLKHFYSDRMHMYNDSEGSWYAEPPSYRCIMNGLKVETREMSSSKMSNLNNYISMNTPQPFTGSPDIKEEKIYGEVLSIKELRERFA